MWKAIRRPEEGILHRLHEEKTLFFPGKSGFVYQGEIRQSMYRFKYSNKREYADFYAKEAVRIYGDWIRRKQIEAIVPVPMYRWKERGEGIIRQPYLHRLWEKNESSGGKAHGKTNPEYHAAKRIK